MNLSKDTVFFNNIIKKSKYCNCQVIKKYFNKELGMNKEDTDDIKNSTKCRICDNDYVDNDVQVRYHCHTIGKYSGCAHRDCNINLKLHHKIPAIFQNLKNSNSRLFMQESDKFNLKINVIPNGLEKYMSFTINKKISFIGSFQFQSSSLDSFVKNLCKDDFKYLSQEYDNNVLDLVKQKGFFILMNV